MYFKGLWAVVNNAAIAINMDVELSDMETYHRVLDVNTFGMVRVCKAFLPLIRKRKGRLYMYIMQCGTCNNVV